MNIEPEFAKKGVGIVFFKDALVLRILEYVCSKTNYEQSSVIDTEILLSQVPRSKPTTLMDCEVLRQHLLGKTVKRQWNCLFVQWLNLEIY